MTAKQRPVAGSFDYARLPGAVNFGSRAMWRKVATSDARAAMAEIESTYAAIVRKLKGMTPEVLLAAMQPVFNKTQEYCPQDTGALVESGRLFLTTQGGRPQARIEYGSPTAWYAALVHEFVWLNHEPPTRAKYVQSAMEEEFDSLLVNLALHYSSVI